MHFLKERFTIALGFSSQMLTADREVSIPTHRLRQLRRDCCLASGDFKKRRRFRDARMGVKGAGKGIGINFSKLLTVVYRREVVAI